MCVACWFASCLGSLYLFYVSIEAPQVPFLKSLMCGDWESNPINQPERLILHPTKQLTCMFRLKFTDWKKLTTGFEDFLPWWKLPSILLYTAASTVNLSEWIKFHFIHYKISFYSSTDRFTVKNGTNKTTVDQKYEPNSRNLSKKENFASACSWWYH